MTAIFFFFLQPEMSDTVALQRQKYLNMETI